MGIREGDFRRRGRRHVRPRSLAHPFATFFSPRVRRSLFAQPTNQRGKRKRGSPDERAGLLLIVLSLLPTDATGGERGREGGRGRRATIPILRPAAATRETAKEGEAKCAANRAHATTDRPTYDQEPTDDDDDCAPPSLPGTHYVLCISYFARIAFKAPRAKTAPEGEGRKGGRKEERTTRRSIFPRSLVYSFAIPRLRPTATATVLSAFLQPAHCRLQPLISFPS